MSGKTKMLDAVIGFLLILLIAVGYTQRLRLFQYLPSTSSEGCSTMDDILVNEETETPFSDRLRTKMDGSAEIYSYKNGRLNSQNVCCQDGRIVEIAYWKNGEQNGHFQFYSDKGILMNDAFFVDGKRYGAV